MSKKKTYKRPQPKKAKGPTAAQKKRDETARAHEMVLNRAREKRKESHKWIDIIKDIPSRVPQLQALMVKDLVRVYNTKHSMLGNTAGRDRYRQIGEYTELLVRLAFGNHKLFREKAELADTPTMTKGATRAAALARSQSVAKYAEEHILPWARKTGHEFSGAKGRDGQVHAIISSDHHSLKCDPFALRVLNDVLAWVQPDYNIWNGDTNEFSDFSTHRHMPGHFDMNGQQEVDHTVEKIFIPGIEASPGSQHIMTMGNHDWRLATYMADRASRLACFRSNSFVDLLGLRDLDIALVCRSNFLAPTAKMRRKDINENWMVLEDAFVVTHGIFTGPNACNAHFKKFQMGGCNGHEHGPHFQSFNSIGNGPMGWYVSPMMAGHAVGRDYVSLPSQWQMGFLHVTICKKTKHVQVNYILVSDTATFGGRTWKITAAEKKARVLAWQV